MSSKTHEMISFVKKKVRTLWLQSIQHESNNTKHMCFLPVTEIIHIYWISDWRIVWSLEYYLDFYDAFEIFLCVAE